MTHNEQPHNEAIEHVEDKVVQEETVKMGFVDRYKDTIKAGLAWTAAIALGAGVAFLVVDDRKRKSAEVIEE